MRVVFDFAGTVPGTELGTEIGRHYWRKLGIARERIGSHPGRVSRGPLSMEAWRCWCYVGLGEKIAPVYNDRFADKAWMAQLD